MCPVCSERITVKEGPSVGESGTGELGDVTIFQPGINLASLFPEEAAGSDAPGAAGGDDHRAPSGGQTGQRADAGETTLDVPAFAAPPLSLDVEAFFLVLGASPGEERIDLRRARTVFGRAGADVELSDAAVSKRHFQIDVMGREFFIRDLGSRHGTYLNGRSVRFTELVPGDEVRVGGTVLVFRTAADGLGRGTSSR